MPSEHRPHEEPGKCLEWAGAEYMSDFGNGIFMYFENEC